MKRLNIIIMFILFFCFTAQGQNDNKEYDFDWYFRYQNGCITDSNAENCVVAFDVIVEIYKEKVFINFYLKSDIYENVFFRFDIDEVYVLKEQNEINYRFYCYEKNNNPMIMDVRFKPKETEIICYFPKEELYLLLINSGEMNLK